MEASGASGASEASAPPCPRCGGQVEDLGVSLAGRYDFTASGPGVLFHLVFFFAVAIGVALFGFVTGYALVGGAGALCAAVLAIVAAFTARRAYRIEEQHWYRCPVCDRQWSVLSTATGR